MLKLKKIISLIVSLCLLISLFFDAVYASKNYNHNASQSFEILDNFRIINSSYKPGTPLIIFINELHSDPQVQQLIYKTLERLYSDGILSQVFTEGAPAEKIDISSLLQPDYEKRKKIIDSLLLSGLVSGAEVFAVNKGFKDIYGIEDWNIYLENLKIAAGIYNSNNSFFDIKENLYDNFSKEMRDTVKKISELHNLNESGLSKDNSYSTVVQNYDEIDKYLKIAGLKKRLDEKAAQKDIYSVFEFLKSNIPYKEFIYITDKYSKSGSEEFLSEFFELLKKRFNNVLADHSALTELLYLNELKYASNPKTLIYQTSLLKNNIIENISLSSDRELAALYFFFELLDKYASLAVSEEEFNDLLRNRNLILKTVFKYFPEKDYAKVAKLLSDNNLLRYYENNIKRNLIFYENIKKNIANMKADNKAVFGGKTYSSVNVTIMGGFHKNTANLFNEDEISFISLIPVMKESQKNVYKDIIRLSSSALAPPLLSAGVENNEINALIDFWSSFGNIYSKQAVQSVNGWFSEKNIAFRVSIGKEHQIIFKKIEPDKKISFKDTVKRFFKKLFSRKKAVVKEDLTKEEIIAGEYLKTLRSLNGKMPDIILVSLKNKEDIQFYKSIIENMPHLANTNIKFITTSDNGTGSSFITISEYVNSIKTGNEFQNLKDKKWQDLKICAINIDGLSKEVTGKEIPFEFNGRRITPFELSLLNGIRACQSFGRRQGGLALMSPENIYVGNMISEGEITVITSMESYGDILNYEMPWIISEQGDIKKMYYMFDSEKIKDKLEKKGILDRMDNLENRDFRQFETTTGNILFSFKDDLLYSSFFERISQLYKHIYTNSSSGIDPPSIDFIQHILIPILRMKNGEDSLSYFTKMGIDDVFGEFYDRYSSFFDSSINKEFQKIIENLSLKTYTQPYSYYASANNPVLPEGIYRQNLINRIDYGDISDNFFVHSVESAYKELFLEVSNSRLQKKYYSLERKDSVSLYKNIAEKSSYDIKRINNYFENHSEIDFNDRKILENLRNLFVSLEYYALEYIRTLDSFENISVLGGYIFPKTSLFERLKIMPFNRFIFGMHRNFQREKEKLRRQAYKLYVLGNNINDSMYDYNALLSDIEEYIKEKEFPGEKTSLGIEKSWSTRKAIHRILSLFLAVSNTLPAVITASSTSSISKIIYSVFTGIGLSIFLHRFMIFIGKRNSFYNAKIKDLFSSGGEYFENLYLNLKIDNDFHFENTGNREELPDIIKRSMEESAAAYLIKWKNVLDSKDFDANNMEIIRKYALQLIRITFFSQDSFNSNNKEQIISIIQDFIKLHKLSMKKIKQMPDDEKEKYELEIKNFEEAGKYAQSYYNVLSYALNADILNGYRVSKGMFFFFLEKTGVLKIVRSIMGINAGIYFSQKGFINSVRNIIYHGNRLIPGLYDEKNLMFFSEKYMESKKRPERFNIGISEHWKVRKMLARTLPLVIFALNIVIHPILFNTPFNMVSSLVTGVGLSVAMHWIPIIPVIYSWFKDIIRDRKLVKELKRNDIESFRNRIIKSKAGDLFGKIPFGKMPDIIFISADLPEDKMSYIKTFISGVKNKGNMKNLTVKYIAKNDIGDGNAVIEVFSHINSEDFKSEYPGIAVKKNSEINAVIMHIDESDYENIFDSVSIGGEKTTPFEVSLINAVGLIQNSNKNGNIVLADPSYLYLGNLADSSGNITLLSADSDYRQIQSQDIPAFISGEAGEQRPGESLVRKIYKTLDVEKISNILLRSTLENILNRQGTSEQFSSFSGISSLSLDDAKMEYLSDYMNELRSFISNYHGRKFKIDFFSHIMIPYVMMKNGENIDTYLAKMISGISDRETRKEYYDFFDKIFEIQKRFYENHEEKLTVNIVHPPESLMSRAKPEDKYYLSVKEFLDNTENQKIEMPKDSSEDILKVSAGAAVSAVKASVNPISFSNVIANEITENLKSKTKTFIFLTPNLTPDYIKHASASGDAGVNSICSALDGDFVNPPESEIIINVPLEDVVISAKASVSRNSDKSFVVNFTPLYEGILSDKEYIIIKSILSPEYETGEDALRKKMFLGRAMLAFIKEAESCRKDLKGVEKIISRSLKDNLISVVSMDGSGVFAFPEIVDDRFYNDETFSKINFCSLYVNKDINGDVYSLNPDAKTALRLSEDTERFNVFTDNKLHVGLLSALFSDASFLLSFNRSVTASIDSEEYKLIRLDRSNFYADAKQYVSNLFELINNLSLKKSENIHNDSANTGIIGKITPSLTLNTISDISALENLVDTKVITSVVISNLFAQTEKGCVIGNVFNPMLADLRREAAEIGYAENSFFNMLFDEKADLKTWKSIVPRFFAAGMLLEYLKAKKGGTDKFEEFKKSKFAVKGEKSFEYITALILSGRTIVTEDELSEIKSANAQKWNAALEQVKYMEFVVFKQLEEDSKKLKSKGITVIIRANLMFLKDSVDFNDGFFEISNDGEAAVLPEYNSNPENFYFMEQFEYLRDYLSAGGFLIANIDSYHSKQRISAYLRKRLQNGITGKMILIFEDEDINAYPAAENTYLLASGVSENQNIIIKTVLTDSSSVEELMETVKKHGSERINIPLSFAGDAGMKFDAIRAGKKDILKSAYVNSSQYYAKGYEDALKNKKLAAESEKITISDEEDSVYRITAKGILIFSALYSYIRTNTAKEKELLGYLSESGALFALAKKHLKGFEASSPLMRYIDNLELRNKSASKDERHLYNMQLMGFMNGVIHHKYGSARSLFKAKLSAFADSFCIKNNFLNFIPNTKDTMSLYGLYLGTKDKENFTLKLREYFKHWEIIYDKGSNDNIAALLWLVEQASLFMNDLDVPEKYEFSSRFVSYLNEIIDICGESAWDSVEIDALYLNALNVCRDFNKLARNQPKVLLLEQEIADETSALSEKYFSSQEDFNPDIILLFSLSRLNGVFKEEDRNSVAKDFARYSLNAFGGVKNGKAYPYYLYYYSLFIPYSQKSHILETLSFYIEENLTLPEFFVRKDGFAAGGNFRDPVSAAYFAMLFDAFNDSGIKMTIPKKEFNKIFESAKAILVSA